VAAASAGFRASTTLNGPAPARFCSAPGSTGNAPLLLIEKLSLLEGATLGAARLVTTGAVQAAVQAAAPGAVRAAAAELGASVSGAAPTPFCSAPGSTGDAPLLLEIEVAARGHHARRSAACARRCAGRCA